MVKKIFFALILINLIGVLKVNAQQLSPPTYFQHFDDGTVTSGSVASSTDNWSNTNVYIGGGIGSFGTNFSSVTQIDFNWFNLNICSGKNVSISGSVHAIFGFFLQQSYTVSFYMNNERLVCSTSIFDNGNALHYDCYGETGGGNFAIYLTENSFTNNVNYSTGVSQDVTYSCDVSNEAIVNQSITNTQNIINNQNSNTNQIIENQDGNTQDIIDNQNQNTQDIIDNQNANTDKEIESQKVCTNFILNKDSIVLPNSYLSSNGSVLSSSTGNGISDYYEISSDTSISILEPIPDRPQNACFYTSSKTLISCFLQNSVPEIPENSKYIRFTLNSSNVNPRFKLSTCINGNQALSDSITSEESPNTNQDINDMNNMVASDTPISDLITMPLTLINAYINGVNSSCSPVNLGNLYGTDLTLPCINLEQRLGTNLWHIIDSFFSIFMCYNIGMLFVTAFDGITSLRDDFEGLYQPRHADVGYQPKHGG